jgi:outer membrane protein assembly factor BamB
MRRIRHRAATAAVATSTLIAFVIAGAPARADSRPARPSTLKASAADAWTSWPELHGNPQLTGLSTDPLLSTTDAGSLGVQWMTQTMAPVLSSPVVAYSAALDKTIAYSTNDAGEVEAMDVATGQIVWSESLGYPMVASPLVIDGSVWVGSEINPTLFKLNADTGASECSVPVSGKLDSSPTYGIGAGGALTIYEGVLDDATTLGPLLAVTAANCQVTFSVTPEPESGPWNPISYATDANGRALAIMGTSDPDDSIYAVDAVTGASAWSIVSPDAGDNDFAAGATISAPGVNGFADGVAYEPGKDGNLYAIDLTTGQLMWTFNFSAYYGASRTISRSTAALDGNVLVFGTSAGVMAYDVVARQVLWTVSEPNHSEVLSSPAIVGPAGQEVVVVCDLGGAVRVLSLATGAGLYSLQTGGYLTSSPAESDGNIVVASSDGFVYDLAVGGGTTAGGTTTISSPAPAAVLANPDGAVTITGSATDPVAVGSVQVAVQLNGATGPWWDAATSSWVDGPVYNSASLDTPGAAFTTWSIAQPVSQDGASLKVFARSVSTTGPADPDGASVNFAVTQLTSIAYVTPSPTALAPGGQLNLSGGNFSPGEQLTVKLGGTPVASVGADPTGALLATVTLPVGYSPYGAALLSVTGQASGLVATFPIDVTNSWTQASQGPTHTGFQANDKTLALASPAAKYTFKRAWLYPDGSPVRFSPTVYDDRVYVIDAAGQLSSLVLQSGALVWTYGAGGPITTSPVLDGSTAYFVVGATLQAVNTSDGTLRWSVALPGPVDGALTIARGRLYVGTTAGTLLTLDSGTGSVVWTTTLAGAIHDAPSVDATAGLAVVGDSSGAVTAVKLTTGARAWQYLTHGAVTASPSLANRKAYVGSADGSVYALSEVKGTLVWSTALAGPVSATAAVSGGTIYVGDATGRMSALSPKTGAVIATLSEYNKGGVIGSIAATINRIEVSYSGGSELSFRSVGTWGTDGANFVFRTSGPLSAGPVIGNNELIVASQDGNVYCETPASSRPL